MTNRILFACIGFSLLAFVVAGIFMFGDDVRTQKETENSSDTIVSQNSGIATATTETAIKTNVQKDLSATGNTTTISINAPRTFTMAQVMSHRTRTSCYTTINGTVYDLTQWIGRHPGGPSAIISLCGTDGTAAFTDQHGGRRRPENELASLTIGTLVK